jgi:hypothetical protein
VVACFGLFSLTAQSIGGSPIGFDGKQKLLTLGVYPDVPLILAPERRDAARKLLATGVDPSENRKAAKATRMERAER